MNPLGNRARAEELARLLEGAVAGPSSTTSGFAALATRLRAVSPALDEAAPLRPEFRAALRQRLLAVATVQVAQAGAVPVTASEGDGLLERAVSWSRTWSGQKRLAAVSGAMAGIVALTGVGVASSRSLPGQPFYGLKRASEGLQLELANGDTAKGTKHLEFASTRLREVRALARGDGELALGSVHGSGTLASGLAGSALERRINDTLEDFDAETASGRSLLEGVYRRTGKTAPLRVLTAFSSQQRIRLSALLPDLPAGNQQQAKDSLTLVADVGSTATELLAMGTCGAGCDPDTAGPSLPVEPLPTPGASATPTETSGSGDNNGVPPCTCVQPEPTPGPTDEPSEGPTPEPTPTPTDEPTPSPTPTPTGTPSPGPLPTLPIPLPTDLPTILPTLLPTWLPNPQDLPSELASVLPTLAPLPALEP